MLKTENKLTATIYYVPTFNTDPIVFLEQVGESLEISTFPLTTHRYVSLLFLSVCSFKYFRNWSSLHTDYYIKYYYYYCNA